LATAEALLWKGMWMQQFRIQAAHERVDTFIISTTPSDRQLQLLPSRGAFPLAQGQWESTLKQIGARIKLSGQKMSLKFFCTAAPISIGSSI